MAKGREGFYRKQPKITETRIMSIEEPKEKDGLFIIYYQQYAGSVPIGEEWKAYVRREDYEVMKLKNVLMREFKVPENLIESFVDALDAARENYIADQREGAWADGYESGQASME
jgi:hypothetical protein